MCSDCNAFRYIFSSPSKSDRNKSKYITACGEQIGLGKVLAILKF